MKLSRFGGVIAAAYQEDSFSLKKLGEISIIERIILTYQQAGIFPIVVTAEVEDYDLRYELAPYGVIFLPTDSKGDSELFDSAKVGFEYLKDKCDRIVFTPVNAPMFTPKTLRTLFKSSAPIARPSYKGKSGHPIVIDHSVIDFLVDYTGMEGLRGSLARFSKESEWVEVEDPGICLYTHHKKEMKEYLKQHNEALLNPEIKVALIKEKPFLDNRLKLLLYLIEETGAVRQARDYMGMSNSKAWKMLNKLEKEVGYQVVQRKHGGKSGGGTLLTKKGKKLVENYQAFEESLFDFSQREFDRLFKKEDLL